jgi:acyl-CoA reductase-like NAD-dependent aldehyde dehydrogenase
VYDEFVEKYLQEAQKIKIGDPFSKETQQGPQVDDI